MWEDNWLPNYATQGVITSCNSLPVTPFVKDTLDTSIQVDGIQI